jgi:hypothetical protein
MKARKNSELLENNWLQNGREEVMVSLSFPFCTAYSRQRNARAKARKAIYQGEGFPRFLASFASEPRTQRSGVSGRATLALIPLRCVRGSDGVAIDLERESERC